MPLTVLVVDDDAGFRRVARRLLTVRGFVVVDDVATGAAAFEAVRRHRPDGVLLDVNLPDRDGLSVTRALAGRAGGPSIVLTSMDAFRYPDAVLVASGARAFVAKERLVEADLLHQPGDDVGVERGTAVGDAAYRVDQDFRVGDLLLQQVAHAVGPVADELEHEPVLEVLAEHDHADPGLRGPDLHRGAQPVVDETRWHADVGDHDVGPVGVGDADEFGGVGGHAGDRQTRPLEHPHDPLPDEGLVLPDDDRQGTGHDQEQ